MTSEKQVADTTEQELAETVGAAAAAFPAFAAATPASRATMLEAVADALDDAADELVPLAIAESHLPQTRLTGEVKRTTFQLRTFSAALREGDYLEAIIETATATGPLGPTPDLRRMLLPLGPVAIYAASNFPFAFSVAGGDTASALAAGCPVVVKAHPGHPRLSRRTAEIVTAGLTSAGAPEGTFGIVYGYDIGIDLLRDERITGGSFTGSIPGGRALFDIANARPTPIPFYAEMGSTNPVFVTGAAVASRGRAIAADYVASFTLGVGQFCTKPGVLFLPSGHGLDEVLVTAASAVAPNPMLTTGIADRFGHLVDELGSHPGVDTLVAGSAVDGGWSPALLTTSAAALRADPVTLLEERFGPTSLIVEYQHESELPELAGLFGGNLTATVHGEESDLGALGPLIDAVTGKAGRVLWNGWPTGVAVSPAMQHGGPYPATAAALHTSVGTTAIRRWLRPVCYQSMPQLLLPPALRDANELGLPRRVDGVVTNRPLGSVGG